MPDDWLEEEEALISDPNASKPSDWDDSMDGEWEAPKIDNPKCKDRSGCGKWTKPMIDNPNYKVSFEFLFIYYNLYWLSTDFGKTRF